MSWVVGCFCPVFFLGGGRGGEGGVLCLVLGGPLNSGGRAHLGGVLGLRDRG